MFDCCRRRTSEGTTTRSSPSRTPTIPSQPAWRSTGRSRAPSHRSRQRRSPTISASGLPPRTRSFLRRIRTTGGQLSAVMREITDAGHRARTSDVPPPAGRAAGDRPQPACDGARQRHDRQDRRPDRPERERVYELAKPVHRRGRRRGRARPGPGIRAVVVGDRADPEDRHPARRDCPGRLLGPGGRHEPGRARCAGRQREPHERRAPASLQGARDRQPAQVRLPRQHVARAPHAAERDHRLLPGAARRDVRRDQREAGGVSRGHPRVREPPARRSSTTSSTCRRSRRDRSSSRSRRSRCTTRSSEAW